MKNGKSEVMLIISAMVIFVSVILYIILDSPKYNSLESVRIKITSVSVTAEDNGKININSADVSELASLDGIGEKKAQSIVEYRKRNGRFRAVEELTDVNGIGESILELNRDKITV